MQNENTLFYNSMYNAVTYLPLQFEEKQSQGNSRQVDQHTSKRVWSLRHGAPASGSSLSSLVEIFRSMDVYPGTGGVSGYRSKTLSSSAMKQI